MSDEHKASAVARIIAVGDELLEGRTADTNSQRIEQALGRHTLQMAGIEVVPDRKDAIGEALDHTREGDLVILCGGLGSTPDDLTRDAVAAWAGVPMNLDLELKQKMEERWTARGIRFRPGRNPQCEVPEGMTPLENPVGSAPGLVGRLRGRTVVLLPGPPDELSGLLPVAIGFLGLKGLLPPERPALLWRTAQVAELSLVRTTEDLRRLHPGVGWSWWMSPWGVDVRAMGGASAEGREALEAVETAVTDLLGDLVFAREMVELPQVVQDLMLARGQTLAVAESCTAGLIGGALTSCGGSSGFFRGGFLTYADEIKHQLLGVSEADLNEHGAVSEPVVKAMAAGCRRRLGTDYGLAVSGISGPEGGTAAKPVGTTWIAVATPDEVFARCYRFPADRPRNRAMAVASAVDNLRRLLVTGDGVAPRREADTWCVLNRGARQRPLTPDRKSDG